MRNEPALFFACLMFIAAATALVVHHVPTLYEVAGQLSASVAGSVPF